MKRKRISAVFIAVTVAVIAVWGAQPTLAQDKPNIIIIWGDDIGQSNISAYTKGLMGYQAGDKNFRVHLDGYNFLAHLEGKEEQGPRKEIFYFSDDGDLTALRYDDWKLIFMEQKAPGTFRVWMEPFVPLRVPIIENLRRDPYERATITSNSYHEWQLDRAYLLVPAQAYVANFLKTFIDYPPRQKAASFSLDKVMEQLLSPPSG